MYGLWACPLWRLHGLPLLRRRDVTYIVRDGEVKIVNTSTGRVLPDTRWMDDLHQVCPAPQAVKVHFAGLSCLEGWNVAGSRCEEMRSLLHVGLHAAA